MNPAPQGWYDPASMLQVKVKVDTVLRQDTLLLGEKAAGCSTRALLSYFPEKPGGEKRRIRQPNNEERIGKPIQEGNRAPLEMDSCLLGLLTW